MRFEGRVWKDKGSKYWLVEVPILDAMTQGTSRADALAMIKEYLELDVDRSDFKVTVHSIRGSAVFEVSSNDNAALIAQGFKRHRRSAGLSLSQVAERLGQKSLNAYARYEQGKSVPTIKKLNELILALYPKSDLVLGISRI